MVAPVWKIVERGEPEVRLRTNFMNQLVIQVRYELVSSLPPDGPWKPAGMSEWRDARATDPREVALVFGILSGVKMVTP